VSTTTAHKVSGIDASYYYVKDLARATKFYTELLGADPTLTVPGMVSEWTFPNGESFGLYKGDSEFRPSGGIMFVVEDVPAAVKSHMGRGVKFHGEGHIEETPVCHMAFGEDTEGNGFMLHKRKGT
jgi:predicted enzyme related to lactoylglutathione lyase